MWISVVHKGDVQMCVENEGVVEVAEQVQLSTVRWGSDQREALDTIGVCQLVISSPGQTKPPPSINICWKSTQNQTKPNFQGETPKNPEEIPKVQKN